MSQRSEKRFSDLYIAQWSTKLHSRGAGLAFSGHFDNTTFWINDVAMCLETVDEGMAKAIACYEKLDFDEEDFDNEDSIGVHPQKRFETSPRIKGYLEDIHLVEWGNKIYSKAGGLRLWH